MLSLPERSLIAAAGRHEVSLLAVFGGQGGHNGTVLSELRQLINQYPSLAQKLIDIAAPLLSDLARLQPCTEQVYEFGLDLDSWLRHPESTPSQAYLATAPISFPLIGLSSLVRYCIVCRKLGLEPGQMREALKGATGHSQGIVVAAVIALAHDWNSFFAAAADGLRLLFWMGLNSHLATPGYFATGSNAINAATVSPMLSVRGPTLEQLEKILAEANSYVPADSAAYVSLVNSADNYTISGPPATLLGIRALLDNKRAAEGQDQSRIPFHRRRPEISHQFLPISAAFHSPYLRDAVHDVVSQLSASCFEPESLGTPIYHTCTGQDLRKSGDPSLALVLAEMVMSDMVDWPKTLLQQKWTHIVDFGPGNTTSLLRAQIAGSGVQLVTAFEQNRITGALMGKMSSTDILLQAADWASLYQPRVELTSDGAAKLQTRMSKLLGMPPIMVAGMTPTTASPELVAAVLNAGFHIELAGGAYSRKQDFESAIRKVARSISQELGITCNLIYANPKAMAWQIPLLRDLIADGVNIEGLTIGAGIPSPEIAKGYIETLRLKHISFKPSSAKAIQQVLDIAVANSSIPVCLQWTSGRAGGHHSCEDFHLPILQMYASIRAHPNVVLIGGGGFGRSEDMLPYLTGRWSQPFGYARMPFDGILMGSRMMSAREAQTSDSVKALIADAQGSAADSWHLSLDSPISGVISVQSELGEPIWKVATRGVMLWKDLDDTIFNIKDRAKRLAQLQSRKSGIIKRLNADFAKPWFATRRSGEAVELEDMVYTEVLQRLVQLMYLPHLRKWVHDSYRTMVLDFIARIGQRLGVAIKDLSSDPHTWSQSCEEKNCLSASDLLHPDDVLFFLELCKRPGQKPVNFVPRLDDRFETWFKKDSLWQMENIEAVIDQDPQRVCIIHGPVAAQFTNTVNEPAGSILSEITNDLAEMLGASPSHQSHAQAGEICLDELKSATKLHALGKSTFTVNLDECNGGVEGLLQRVFGNSRAWVQECLSTDKVYRDGVQVDNPIRASLRPVKGDMLRLTFDSSISHLEAVTLSTRTRNQSQQPVFHIESINGQNVLLVLSAPMIDEILPARIEFTFRLTTKQNKDCVIHEITRDRNGAIRAFFAKQWDLDTQSLLATARGAVFSGPEFTVLDQHIKDFLAQISRSQSNRSTQPGSRRSAPMDLSILVAWPALMKPLMCPSIGGDIFRLLHRSNSFEYINGAAPLEVGDVVQTTSLITAITVNTQGKLVEVTATIHRNSIPVVKVLSTFLIQGRFTGSEKSFRLRDEDELEVNVASPTLEAVLKSRPWVRWSEKDPELLGRRIRVRLSCCTEPLNEPGLSAIRVTGEIHDYSEESCLGLLDFQNSCCATNPVLDLFKQHGNSTSASPQLLAQPGNTENMIWTVRVPDSGTLYSRLSTDRNPIHTSAVFAGLASLPGPIVHGMWTSAVVRNVLEEKMADGNGARFRRWACSFEGMVKGNDSIRIEARHTAMVNGRMILKIRAYNEKSNMKVLDAEAEIEQPTTAYLFCGQGSQQKGMGMELYESSPAAQKVWNRCDKFLYDLYGFSLLDIVRSDPKEITIHFTGVRGRKLLENYLALTRQVTQNGEEVCVGVIEGLTRSSTSYTFQDSRGLLSSTQFAQPALTVMELAEMEALRARGLVQQGAQFAGHSLGEYAGLASCTTILPIEEMLSLVFYRGLVMQRALERDAFGRTDFAMVAVNPSRIGSRFQQASLEDLISIIRSTTGLLLEIVNYNVSEQQYVCAGHLVALQVLDSVCTSLSQHRSPELATPSEITSLAEQHFASARRLPTPIKLERGTATIPLQGIDVPFHSTYLRGGIDAYRRFLLTKIQKSDIKVEELVGRFIPNVVGKVFSTSREYVAEVVRITGSEPLKELLASMG